MLPGMENPEKRNIIIIQAIRPIPKLKSLSSSINKI
jgi:hypothetical protein